MESAVGSCWASDSPEEMPHLHTHTHTHTHTRARARLETGTAVLLVGHVAAITLSREDGDFLPQGSVFAMPGPLKLGFCVTISESLEQSLHFCLQKCK